MRLDQACFNEHVASPPFQDGVARGYWDIAPRDEVEWPYVIIWIDLPAKLRSEICYVHANDGKITVIQLPNVGTAGTAGALYRVVAKATQEHVEYLPMG